jgi:hypothetical protein
MQEKFIQFVANYDGWVAIKKLKIEAATDPRSILEFLASLTTGIDRKVEENLGKIVELGKLKAAVESVFAGGKGADAISEAIAAVNSPTVNKTISEITEKPEFQKNEQAELQGFCKAFAMRHALKKCGLMIDYSEIEIPGMKRLLKKKV